MEEIVHIVKSIGATRSRFQFSLVKMPTWRTVTSTLEALWRPPNSLANFLRSPSEAFVLLLRPGQIPESE